MKTKYIFSIVIAMLLSTSLMAQLDQYLLDAQTNGTTVTLTPGVSFSVLDDGGLDGAYSGGYDYSLTIQGTCEDPYRISMEFDIFDINPTDTLYIYDGANIATAPLIIKANSNYNNLFQKTIYMGPNNLTNAVTIRLKSSNAPAQKGQGFAFSVKCAEVCENVLPVIDSVYYRTRNGVIYDTCVLELVHEYDIDTLTGDTLAENIYESVNLCQGDGVVLDGHIEWDDTYATGYYTPTNDNTKFLWSMGVDGEDQIGLGLTRVQADGIYNNVACYDVLLNLTNEEDKCPSKVSGKVVIRIAQNPIKTIFDLATICTGDTLVTTLGYDGEDATITLKRIEFSQTASKTNDVRTFIPDGPRCDIQCYVAPVDFHEFPHGKKITSKEEICSICINYEHSFMGDYRLSLVCPNGSKAILKYASQHNDPLLGGSVDPNVYPDGSYGGGSTYTGIPLENSSMFDGPSGQECDSLRNLFGIGWNYCFSRNNEYTLVTGEPADTQNPGQHYLGNRRVVAATAQVPAPPAYFNSSYTGGSVSVNTQDSSDHDGKMNYYMPWSDFSELVGCSMNGTWEVEVCDYWGLDNGWVFNWSLDLCGVSSGGCEYQVGLDSLLWLPDTAGGTHCDYETGKYRGVEIVRIDSVSSGVTTTDTAGYFPINVVLYDEFGCVWDTSTSITTTWTPRPDLGDGGVICGDQYMVLNAKDSWTDRGNYTYLWDPTGEFSDTIKAGGISGKEITYTAEVYNTQNGIRCTGRDNTTVNISVQPIPNFDIDQYPLEGCEPYTINIKNSSIDATHYRWEFGDGTISTEKDPRHTYSEGTYDFKFYVTSDEGCIDSLIYDKLVTVFPSPDARFSWEPVYPTMSDPTVNLENRTVPDDPSMKYFWEIQYDKNYPYSYHTLPAKDTSFTWETNGEDISGDYVVRLISRSDNVGPSGYPVYCSDTVENTILILNDFIQFPNLVTPNGDGINDKFVIINLISGQAYPTNSLDIYNKWGARVYHCDNISKEEDFWDPAADNIPTGTYFYHFVGRGYNGSVERNGAVEVLK